MLVAHNILLSQGEITDSPAKRINFLWPGSQYHRRSHFLLRVEIGFVFLGPIFSHWFRRRSLQIFQAAAAGATGRPHQRKGTRSGAPSPVMLSSASSGHSQRPEKDDCNCSTHCAPNSRTSREGRAPTDVQGTNLAGPTRHLKRGSLTGAGLG